MPWYFWLLLGIYITLGIISFLVSGFFAVLGGKEKDLWKPFVCLIFPPFIFKI